MANRAIRIIVGASLDRDALTVFAPLVASSARAKKAIDTETKAAGNAVRGNLKKGIDPAEKSFKELEKWAKTAQRDIDRETKSAASALAKNIAKGTKDAAKDLEKMATDAERASRRMVKAVEASERKRGRDVAHQAKESAAAMRGGIAGAQRLGGMAYGAARTGVGFAARVAGDVARGAGADLDLASQSGKASDLQSKVTDITNSGYMAGAAGPNGQRQDAAALTKELSKAASETGFAVNDAAEGLQKFVSKTGDLETGRAVFKDLAVLSRATGTNLEDMVDAAGDVSNQLGDIPNKAEVINKVMRQIAGEGKLGAVEIKDLATQMAKIASAAGRFEGGAAANIGEMGMLAQEARAHGGAASATQAATSVAAFTNVFAKGARLHAFKKFGVDVQGANGDTRHASDIIIDSIKAASSAKNGGLGAMNENMGKMFADVRARTTTLGFEKAYRDAGGGEKGEEAIRAEMKRLGDVALQEAEIMESFNLSMKTGEAQANSVNNQLQAVAGQINEAVIPALLDLTPALLSGAKSFAGAIDWLLGKGSKPHVDAVTTLVGDDIKNTQKQLGQGYVLDKQIEKNKADENDARTQRTLAAGEARNGASPLGFEQLYKDDKGLYGPTAKTALRTFDASVPGQIASNLFGGGVGEKEILRNRHGGAQGDLDANAVKAQKALDEIKANNDIVEELRREKVITVKVSQGPPPAIKAPIQGSPNVPTGGSGDGT